MGRRFIGIVFFLADFLMASWCMGQAPGLGINPSTSYFCDGQVVNLTATVFGGVTPYSFLWSEGSTTQSISVTALPGSMYEVTVTGGNGQSNSMAKVLNVFQVTGSDQFCQGQGQVLSVSPAAASYAWSTGATTQAISYSPPVGSDSVYVIVNAPNVLNCILTHDYTVTPSLTVNAGQDTNLCQGQLFILGGAPSVSGGNGTFAIQWTSSPAGFTSLFSNPSITASGTKTYYLTVVSGFCTKTDSVKLVAYPFPVVTCSFSPNNVCSGTPVQFSTTVSPVGSYTYTWNFGDGTTGTGANPLHTFSSIGNGTQTYTVTYAVANMANCSTIGSAPVQVIRKPSAVLGAGSGTSITSYGGGSYFYKCGVTISSLMNFTNQSTTSVTNASYSINWGDGTSSWNAATFNTAVSHWYPVGYYQLVYTVTGANGCVNTVTYNVFVGSNPAIQFGNAGNTDICAPDSIEFLVNTIHFFGSQIIDNPPGTVYTVNYNDGSLTDTFYHPPPSSFFHVFDHNSCGTFSTNGYIPFPNSYAVYFTAQNPCGTNASSVVPIYVSDKPTADFEAHPDRYCLNDPVWLVERGNTPQEVTLGTCDTLRDLAWEIDPPVGWTLLAGALGSFSLDTLGQAFWNSGSDSIQLNFSVAGDFTVRLFLGNLCGIDSFTQVIHVYPNPSIGVDANPAPVCVGFNSVISASATGGTPPYHYEWSDGATTSTLVFSPGIPDDFMFYVTVTDSDSTQCVASDSLELTALPIPLMEPLPDVIVCPDEIVLIESFESIPAGANFVWSNSNPAIGIPLSGADSIPAWTAPTNLTGLPIQGVVSVTAILNGCEGPPVSFTVTVKPTPLTNPLPDLVFCPGDEIDIPTFTSPLPQSGFSWSNSTTTIGLDSSGLGQIADWIAPANTTGLPFIGNITVEATLNGCTGPAQSFSVTVNSQAVFLPISTISVCPGDTITVPAFQSNPPANMYLWANSNGNIGLGLDGVGDIPPWVAPSNGTGVMQTGTIFITGVLNSCISDTSFQIQIHPTPVLLPLADLSVCPGDSIIPGPFVLSPGGAGFQWEQAGSPVGTGPSGVSPLLPWIAPSNNSGVPVSAVFTLVPSLEGCQGIPVSFSVMVNPTPAIVLAPIPPACPGETISIPPFESSPVGCSYIWTNAVTAVGLSPSGTGFIDSWVAPPNLTGAPLSSEVLVEGLLNNCEGENSFTVTVLPTPVVDPMPDADFCPGDVVAIGNFTGSPAGVEFSWTCSTPSMGPGASGTGNLPPWVAVGNATGLPLSTTITVTPSLNNCIGTPMSFVIRIKPVPEMLPEEDWNVCPQSQVGPISFASLPPGAEFSWTNTASQIGLGTLGNGDIASWTAPANASGDSISGFLVVVPTLNGCVGDSQSFSVTILPTSIIVPMADLAVCPGDTFPVSAILTNPPAQSLSWTNSDPGVGLPANGLGAIPPWLAPGNSGGSPLGSTLVVTSVLNGCSYSTTFQAVVKPTPVVQIPGEISQCPGTLISPTPFASVPPGAEFSWANSSTVTGLGNSGNGSIGSWQAPPNATGLPLQSWVTVFSILDGCEGVDSSFAITIKPSPEIGSIVVDSVCGGLGVVMPLFVTNPPGASFIWQNDNALIGLPASGTGQISGWMAPNNQTGQAVTGMVQLISNLNDCQDTLEFPVTIKPNPLVEAQADTAFCPGEAVLIPGFSVQPSGSNLQWTYSGPFLGLGAAGPGNVPPWVAVSNFNPTSLTGTLSVLSEYDGCIGDPMVFSVSVKPSPVLASLPEVSVCPGNQVQIDSFTSIPPGSEYAWTNGNLAIGLVANGAGSIGSWVSPENNTGQEIISIVTVVPVLDGCTGMADSFQISLLPGPVMAPLVDLWACPGDSIIPADFQSNPPGAVFTWGNSNMAIGLALNGSGSIPPWQAPPNSTGTPLTALISVTCSLNTCTSSDTFQVGVRPTPFVAHVADRILCPGEGVGQVLLQSLPPGATISWSNDQLATGMPGQGSNVIGPWTAASNTSGFSLIGIVTMMPVLNGCVGPDSLFLVILNPTPVVAPIVVPQVCPGDAFSIPVFSSSPPGDSFSWSNSNQAIGIGSSGSGSLSGWTAPANPGPSTIDATVTVTAVSDGCPGTGTFGLTILPTPQMVPVSDMVFCPGVSGAVPAFSSLPPGASFVWSNSNTGIGLPGGGLGDIPVWSTPGNSAGTSIVGDCEVVATQWGCTSAAEEFQISIDPTPVVTSPLIDTICSGLPYSYTAAGNVSGTVFSWSRAVVPGISNPAASGSGASISENLVNTAGVPVSVYYILNPTGPGPNFCPGTPDTLRVVVNPVPTITSSLVDSVCSGEAFIYQISSAAQDAVFSWNRPLVAGISNASAGGTGSVITETLINTTSSPLLVPYILTPSSVGTSGLPCEGLSFTFTLTVLPVPTVTSSSSLSLCSGVPLSYQISGGISGTTFSWSRALVPGIQNPATSNTTSLITESLVNTTNAPVSVLYQIVPFGPAPSLCEGAAFSLTITVNPIPVLSLLQAADTLCSLDPLTVQFSSNVAGSQFSWQPGTNPNLSGFSGGNGASGSFSQTLANSANAIQFISYSVSVAANGCNGNQQVFTAGVWPLPGVSTYPLWQSLCSGENSQPVPFSSSVAGTGFAWQVFLPAWVSGGLPSGVDSIPSVQWTSQLTTPSSVTFTVTPSANGCPGPTVLYQLHINPLPVADFSVDSVLCRNVDSPFSNLSQGASTFAWDFGDGGVSNLSSPIHQFADTGFYMVILQAVTDSGCVRPDSLEIEVTQSPMAGLGVNVTSGCSPLSVEFQNMSTGLYVSYEWNMGNGASYLDTLPPDQVYLEGLADSTYTIWLAASNLCGSDTVFQNISAYALPIADFSINQSWGCSPYTPLFTPVVLGMPDSMYFDFGGGDVTNWFANQNAEVPHTFVAGTVPVVYPVAIVALNGCGTDTAFRNVTVYPNTTQAFLSADTTMGCPPLTVNFQNYSVGHFFNLVDFGDGISDTTQVTNFAHTYSEPGVYLVQLMINDTCSYDTATLTITVFSPPVLDFVFDTDSACVGEVVTLTNTSSWGVGFTWVMPNGVVVPAGGQGATLTLTFPASGLQSVSLAGLSPDHACPDTLSGDFTVAITPEVAFSPSLTNGCEPLLVSFSNSSLNAGYYLWDFGDGVHSNGATPIHAFQTEGVYSVNLVGNTGFNDCLDSVSVNITVHPKPELDFSFPAGQYSCDYPVTVLIQDQSLFTSVYLWDFGNGFFSGTSGNQSVSYSQPGSYTIKLLGENIYGCTDSILKVFQVYQKPIPGLQALPVQGCEPLAVSFGDDSQFADSVMVRLNNGDWFHLTNQPVTQTFQAGIYDATLFAYNQEGCSDSLEYLNLFEVFPLPATYVVPQDTLACENDTVEVFAFGADSYQWQASAGTVFSTSPDGSSASLVSDQDVLAWAVGVTAEGCQRSDTLSMRIEVLPVVQLGPDTCLEHEETILLDAGPGGKSYLWSNGDVTRTILFSIEEPQEYDIQVTVASEACPDVTDAILISPCPLVNLPNAFSPNGDGMNDCLRVDGLYIKSIQFRIFNRLGQLVYNSRDVAGCWDGNYLGVPQEVDVYMCQIAGTFTNGQPFNLEGNVTLLR